LFSGGSPNFPTACRKLRRGIGKYGASLNFSTGRLKLRRAAGNCDGLPYFPAARRKLRRGIGKLRRPVLFSGGPSKFLARLEKFYRRCSCRSGLVEVGGGAVGGGLSQD
jgi:hypothetical protein